MRRIGFFGFCVVLSLCVLLLLITQQNSDLNQRMVPSQSENIEEIVPLINYSLEFVLDESRTLISREMGDYKYMAGESLDSLTPITNGNPRRNLIITTWRSGSTFLGEILNAVPGTLYHYEPFSDYDIVQIRGSPEAENAVNHLKKLLNCNYTNMDSFLEFSKHNVWVFYHNTRLWDQCQKYPHFCFEPKFLSQFCKLFPFQIMKVVRLRLRLAEELLKEPTVRVLFLVRDPRGTLQSRKHRTWCPGQPDCDQPSILCSDLVSDYSAAIRLQKLYPDRFRVIRYEDLSLNPFEQVQDLLQFFQLDFGETVRKFLDNHTKFDMGGVSSTFRNSKSAPFHWRSDLEFNEVRLIEDQCSEAMELWGYVRAPNETELKLFNPLTDYKVER
ncbi:carbohydrate sulfotransferase 5-like [Chrysoperla carnea]|uniref:carbohydrate sulfotransferase 5-like n=1 Tax=Chrysoperla carnea TaxID=189513 RepID=UPI001D0961B7|nr:carbohydrate sulfotransferase 5-like [Chrysoperla carnea]